jgi:predicted SAM-dependent methyltransferase
MKKLNLGCGEQYMEDCDNWDISKEVKTDAILDFRKDIFPAEDETYDEIYCWCVIEQVDTNDQLTHIMNEMHRVLKTGGFVTIGVPNAKYSIANQDPHDNKKFTEPSFQYFDHREVRYKRFGKTYGYKPWEIKSIITTDNKMIRVELTKI